MQGSSKRKGKQLKNVVKDKETDTPMDKTQDKFVSDHQSGVFTSLANDETTVGEIVFASEGVKKENSSKGF